MGVKMDNNQLQNPGMDQQNNNYAAQQPVDSSFMGQPMEQPNMESQFQQGYPYMGQQPMGQQPIGQQDMSGQPIQQDPNAGQYTYTIPWMNGTGTASNTTAYTPIPQPPQYNAGQSYVPNQSYLPSQPYPPIPGQQQQTEGMGLAIAGMVFGILSILLCICNILDVVLVLPGIILSSVALAGQKPGKGMAIAGLICSIIGFLLSGIIFLAALMS